MQLGIHPSEPLLFFTLKNTPEHFYFAHWKNTGKDKNEDIHSGSEPAQFGQEASFL